MRYNQRSESVEVLWTDKGEDVKWRPLIDRSRHNLSYLIERLCLVEKLVKQKNGETKHRIKNVKFPADAFRRALHAVAYEREVDAFLVWLESLPPWDGVKRLDGLLTRYFETDSPEVFLKWAAWGTIGGAIARGYEPGKKQDEAPVLIGGQGIGKSTFWSLLLPDPDWYTDDLNLSETHQKRVENMLGAVIAECAELQGIRRTELNNLKAFMSSGSDKLRLAYRENQEAMPRRVVLVGTTNDNDCIPKDDAGNRRFVPIRVSGEPGLLADRIRRDLPEIRDQVWAEGLARYREGVSSYLPYEYLPLLQEETKKHESVNEVTDQAITEAIERLVEQGGLIGEESNLFKMKQVTDEMGEMFPKMNRLKEIGHSLRALGCEKKQHRTHKAVWVVPGELANAHRDKVAKQDAGGKGTTHAKLLI